jgi:hypothetical protein
VEALLMVGSAQASTGSKWDRLANQSALIDVLRSPRLIDRIQLLGNGRLEVQAVDWKAYWEGALSELPPALMPSVAALEQARRRYIGGEYRLTNAIEYCHAYFALLRHLLTLEQSETRHVGLRTLLGMESFLIASHRGQNAAGTISLRHPVYLLAKLREPRAYDDPKFLALVAPLHSSEPRVSLARLYYHYRQMRFQRNPPASFFFYPAADKNKRASSFACVEEIQGAMSAMPDPRCQQRAEAIADWAVAPFLARRKIPSGAGRRRELSVLDIGGGTGALLAAICKRLLSQHASLIDEQTFTWTIIDAALQDASRWTGNRRLRQRMSWIHYRGMDFRSWIRTECQERNEPRVDVALVCRFLNNLSHVDVVASGSSAVMSMLSIGRGGNCPFQATDPVDCLRKVPPDIANLRASNSAAYVLGGRTFRQASLSSYYEGLWHVSRPMHGRFRTEAAFFPLRRFDTDELLVDGRWSLLEALCSIASLVVIEDVDLAPDTLHEHLKQRGLVDLAARDATDRRRMQSAHILCLTQRRSAEALPGRRIW